MEVFQKPTISIYKQSDFYISDLNKYIIIILLINYLSWVDKHRWCHFSLVFWAASSRFLILYVLADKYTLGNLGENQLILVTINEYSVFYVFLYCICKNYIVINFWKGIEVKKWHNHLCLNSICKGCWWIFFSIRRGDLQIKQ